jgi:hypothetical protein
MTESKRERENDNAATGYIMTWYITDVIKWPNAIQIIHKIMQDRGIMANMSEWVIGNMEVQK